MPVDLLRGAGAQGISVDLDGARRRRRTTRSPTALEAGERALLGVVPSVDPASAADRGRGHEPVQRLLDMLGLAPTERTVLTPTCGLAGASPAWARRALEQARATSGRLDRAR